MCELDRRVVENIMEHFGKFDSWVLKENIHSKRLEILFQNGAEFVKT